MRYLDKVLYRKWLQDARAIRAEINEPAHRCFITGLCFNAKTRTASYWSVINRMQQLRVEGSLA